jgi:hypothetical protein
MHGQPNLMISIGLQILLLIRYQQMYVSAIMYFTPSYLLHVSA